MLPCLHSLTHHVYVNADAYGVMRYDMRKNVLRSMYYISTSAHVVTRLPSAVVGTRLRLPELSNFGRPPAKPEGLPLR